MNEVNGRETSNKISKRLSRGWPTHTDQNKPLRQAQGRQREVIEIFSLRDDLFCILKSRRQKSVAACVRLENVANGWLIKELASMRVRQFYPLLGINLKPGPIAPVFY
jgi:hypothetical protein